MLFINMHLQLAVFFALGVVVVLGGEPVVECPAPRSPNNGQAFLYREGQVVKYVCEPGYVLRGREMVRCADGAWEEPAPVCVSMDEAVIAEDTIPFTADEVDASLPQPPSRPLFNWGSDVEEEGNDDHNVTSSDDETPMGDEARVRMVLYPRRMARIVQARVARLNRATELEEEERRRSGSKDKTGSTTTIHLQAPPSYLYLRRTVGSNGGKSDNQDKTSALHMTVEEDKDQVQVVALPRAAQTQSDKGEDALRQYYWMAQQHYYYPRQSSSLVDYTTLGHPYTLTESQWAWINSLHPELRDQYLRDLYGVRTDLDAEGARAQAFLRRYGDAYLYHPYYYRQAMSVVSQDLTSKYDYSCNQAGYNFVTAPKLRHAHIARYDRRQNPNAPNNHYLAAVYRCNPGYVMLDTRFTELFCSRRSWIGTEPLCVPARA